MIAAFKTFETGQFFHRPPRDTGKAGVVEIRHLARKVRTAGCGKPLPSASSVTAASVEARSAWNRHRSRPTPW